MHSCTMNHLNGLIKFSEGHRVLDESHKSVMVTAVLIIGDVWGTT
jgi:hypothetical protein